MAERAHLKVRSATVRFAGDSGDGMQVAGSQFADIVAMSGAVARTLQIGRASCRERVLRLV